MVNKASQGDVESPLKKFRHGLSRQFPDLLDRVMEGYRSFSGNTPPEDNAKEFSAHHGACKAALAHLALLIRLADWVEKGREDVSLQNDKNKKLIDEARMALCDFKKDTA